MTVCSINPGWGRDGDRVVTEVNKGVHSRPVVESIRIHIAGALVEPMESMLSLTTIVQYMRGIKTLAQTSILVDTELDTD